METYWESFYRSTHLESSSSQTFFPSVSVGVPHTCQPQPNACMGVDTSPFANYILFWASKCNFVASPGSLTNNEDEMGRKRYNLSRKVSQRAACTSLWSSCSSIQYHSVPRLPRLQVPSLVEGRDRGSRASTCS